MGNSFVKVYGSILTSSIWMEDAPTRITWLTLLVMADEHGFVEASSMGIAHHARVTPEQCRTALDLFQKPDPDSKDPANNGRRIVRVDGGFIILNHQKYRERRSNAQKQTAERVRKWREKRDAEAMPVAEPQSVTCNASNALLRSETPEAEAEAEAEVQDKNHRSDSYLLSPDFVKSLSKKPFADWLMDEWNQIAVPCGLPRWVVMSASRRKRCAVLEKQFPDREKWTHVITTITMSKFCLGKNDRGWKADPEFLLRDDTYARGMEGALKRWGASGTTNGAPVDVRQQVETGNAQNVARRLQKVIDEGGEE
jgi:hypothetical protein